MQKPSDTSEATIAGLKASAAVGVFAALGLLLVVNVISARQFKRIDATSAKLYTLSKPTLETLHSLNEPIEINVLLSGGDPLLVSMKHTLTAYQAESTKLNVRYMDPDRNPAEFLAIQQKYKLLVGKTEDGRVVADATVVVVKGDKRWFLTPDDLVDIGTDNEGRSRPKLEQGLTIAIRHVLSDERTKICFSKGHGELGTDEGGPRGLGELKYRMDRNNFEVAVIDGSAMNAPEQPWKGCSVALIAGPNMPFTAKEADTLKDYIQKGGSLMLFANPILDDTRKRVLSSGLDSVLALGGIELRGDLVFEQEKSLRLPDGFGEQFFGTPKAHAITEALMSPAAQNLKMVFALSQSMSKMGTSAVQPATLVESSKESFGVADIFQWVDSAKPPEKRASDHEGPLALAMASELPKTSDSAPRGARMVVVGTSALTQGRVWQTPALRGSAFFVESALAWLTASPQIVDVPQKPSVMAGLRLTEEAYAQVRNYVLFYMPAAVALLGVAVFLRRKSTERQSDRSDRNTPTKKKSEEKP